MAITLDGTTGITTPDITSTTSTLGALTQALDLGSTGQIVFPATQNASANANTLDDYEEGTFSTTFNPPNNLSGTGVLDQANYTKVGRLVTISGRITGYSIVSSSTLTYPVISIPFPMPDSVTAISGSSVMTFSGAWAVGCAVDNSSGDATTVAFVFPPSLITTTGSTVIWFSVTYSANA